MRGRLTAFLVSVLAHGAVVALLVLGLPWSSPTGAVDHGLQGIEISLAAGGTPAPPKQAPPPQEPEPQKVEERPAEPPARIVPPPEPLPVLASRSEDPAIEEMPRPYPKPRAQRRPPPKPESSRLPEPATPAPVPSAAPAPQNTEVAAAPVSPGVTGERVAPGAGAGPSVSNGGIPGVEADYYAQLLAWLEKHKEYPRGAQLGRQQGVAHLRFTIDSAGNVLDFRLARSSGHDALDDAVERMIRNAGPLPPIPVALGKERLDLVVPVQFFLKQR